MRSDVLPPALPAFDTLDPAAALAHLKATLETQRTRVKALTEHRDPTWETLVETLDDVSDALSNAWGRSVICSASPARRNGVRRTTKVNP